MDIPEDPIKKAVQRPDEAFYWVIDEFMTRFNGWYPFDHEWDILVVLDACRYDLGRDSVAADRFGPPDKVWSVGASSPLWIRRAFGNASVDTLRQTAYISGNPFIDRAPDELALVDNVLSYAFDEDIGTVPPRPITDRTIDAVRRSVAERYVVHYMQPHLPPVDGERQFTDFIGPKGDSDSNPWRDVEDGKLEPEVVTQAYRGNLESVVSDVDLLLSNVDAENVVITADHGNYLGERGRWGHRYNRSIHPAVRSVPLWAASGSDEQTHEPAEYDRTETDTTREERLTALGYI